MSVEFYPVIALGITRDDLNAKQVADLQEIIDKDEFQEFEASYDSGGDSSNVVGYSIQQGVGDFSFMSSDIMLMQNQFNKVITEYPSLKKLRPRLYLTLSYF